MATADSLQTGRRGSSRAVLVLLSPLLLLVSAARLGASEPIFPTPIDERVLQNGLRLVVVPWDSPGIVAFFTVVRTGSRDEVDPGRTGFAHFFEHVMFRGTERYSMAAYNDALKVMGADANAFTSDDWTRYYIVGPSRGLERMMELESDRFQNLSYGEEAFRTEALAVLGEYNKNQSNPFRQLRERLRLLAFTKHPYRHTTMGLRDDIVRMPGLYTYSLEFFRRFYRPENCILLVAGDVDPDAFEALAQRYYGSWAGGYEPVEVPVEPPPAGEQRDEIAWPGPIRPHLMIGYRTPAFSAENVDVPALDVASQFLFSESAPLYQELVVERQWVDILSGAYADHRDPYLFEIVARLVSADLVPGVEATMAQHIETLQAELVDAERLQQVKSYLRYSFALSLDSAANAGDAVAHYLSLTGRPETMNELFEQYERVTPEDVRRIARKIFVPEGRTTVLLTGTAADGSESSR